MIQATALIIARDEAANIERCVRAIAPLVAEVLVIDSGSSDGTVDIARSSGALVIETHWRGYGAQKNYGAKQASYPWIVSLDADEVPDAALSATLGDLFDEHGAMPVSDGHVYGLLRITDFCGHWVRHGSWASDVVWRIYHRHQARWDERPVHETLITNAKREVLPGELLHYSYPDLASHDRKMEPYLSLSVDSLYQAGRRATWTKRHLAPVWRAFSGYVLKGGWRDGWAGRELAHRDYRMVKEKYRRLAERWRQNEQA